jgi:hypothetical protein
MVSRTTDSSTNGPVGIWFAKNPVEKLETSKLKRRNPNIERLATFGICCIVRKFVFNIDDKICNYFGITRICKLTRVTTKGEQV